MFGNIKKLHKGESVMQEKQLHTSPTVDTLPAARGILLATAISTFFWLMIGSIVLLLV
jgi:hypothetical protein